MPKEDETVSLEDAPMELPPPIEHFLGKLKADRKKLMRDKAFLRPEQLRAFVGTYLYPRIIEAVEMLAAASFDTYSLAVSNANGLQRLHAFTVHQLQGVGADLDEDARLPGVSPEVMDDFQQAFFALGVVLKAKLPDDKDAQDAFNRCAGLLAEMVGELMGEYERDDDDDDRDDDDDDDDDRDDEDDDRRADDAGEEVNSAVIDAAAGSTVNVTEEQMEADKKKGLLVETGGESDAQPDAGSPQEG